MGTPIQEAELPLGQTDATASGVGSSRALISSLGGLRAAADDQLSWRFKTLADTNRTIELGFSLRQVARELVGQAQSDGEGTVNVVEFVARQQAVRLAQATGVYGSNLFDEDSSWRAIDLYFRPEGGR